MMPLYSWLEDPWLLTLQQWTHFYISGVIASTDCNVDIIAVQWLSIYILRKLHHIKAIADIGKKFDITYLIVGTKISDTLGYRAYRPEAHVSNAFSCIESWLSSLWSEFGLKLLDDIEAKKRLNASPNMWKAKMERRNQPGPSSLCANMYATYQTHCFFFWCRIRSKYNLLWLHRMYHPHQATNSCL